MVESNTGAQIEMPKYKCTKDVHALKIKNVVHKEDGSAELTFADDKYAPRHIADAALVAKLPTTPEDQGYLVVYKDGYTSWSPTKAFEEGYELI